MMNDDVLSRGAASEGAPGWRYMFRRMQVAIEAPDPAGALDVVADVGALARERGRDLDIDLRGSQVFLSVGVPDGGVSAADIEFANEVTKLIDTAGRTVDPSRLTVIEFAIDAMDIPAVKPFWEAVLGYRGTGDVDAEPPYRRGPALWFQQMDEPRTQRNRIHIDVSVPHDQAEQRIAAALAAGGRLLSDDAAPSFWVLADAEGNEACICTWQGRD